MIICMIHHGVFKPIVTLLMVIEFYFKRINPPDSIDFEACAK